LPLTIGIVDSQEKGGVAVAVTVEACREHPDDEHEEQNAAQGVSATAVVQQRAVLQLVV